MRPPEKLLTDLYWSFQATLPGNAQLMEAALREYHEDVGCDFNEKALLARLPISSLNIIFKYDQRGITGAWLKISEVVQIRRTAAPTPSELLHELHFAVEDRLADQDHHFFEGLWLCDPKGADGLPVYELCLGS